MTRLAFGFWVTLSLLAVAQVGHAQNYEGFRLDRLELPPTIEDGIALQLPNTLGHLRWSAALTLNYTHSPLVIEPQPEVLGEGRVVADRLQAQVVAALGLAEFAEIHARAPVVLSQGGDRIPLVSDPRPAAFAAADVTVGGSLRLLGAAERGPQLGLVGELVLPSGSQEAYGSDKGVGPRVLLTAAHVVPSAVTIALQLGGLYRPERQYADAQLGSEALGALGVYVTSVPRLVVGAEVLGALALASSNSASHTAKSLEAQLGVRYTAAPGFAAQLAAGAGLNNDVGVPQLRALLSLGFAPPKHAPPPPPPPRPEPPPPLDTDRDGIVDDQDHCPFEAEDPDQFQDEDGCPDTDNDGDGVLDKLDRCPLQAEDPDGYSDADGCPDMDNDEDGLPDERDKCPMEPEDIDGWQDEDGCPDPSTRLVVRFVDDEDGAPVEGAISSLNAQGGSWSGGSELDAAVHPGPVQVQAVADGYAPFEATIEVPEVATHTAHIVSHAQEEGCTTVEATAEAEEAWVNESLSAIEV